MEQLVAENVYRRVHMYDYQGVCFMGEKQDNSRSNYLLNVSSINKLPRQKKPNTLALTLRVPSGVLDILFESG